MIAILFFIAHWYLSLFFHSFFNHRYASHKMFNMSKGMEKFFFIMSWLTQGSSYLSPYIYGMMHRMHHAYADTEKDPHSPKIDKDIVTMFLKTKRIFTALSNGKMDIEERFTKGLPEWHSFDRFVSLMWVRVIWGLIYIGIYVAFVDNYWMFILIPAHFLITPLQGVVVNWFAHKYGYANFDLKNTSKNFLPVDLLMWGESYHNNHHKFASRANFGYKWWEIDPMYPIILLMDKLRMIRLVN